MVKKLISIIGLTSSGKSSLGIYLAKLFNGEIVSADSRQVFIGMDYCTGKITKQEAAEVKHHLIDIISTNTNYSLAQYQKDAYNAIDTILQSNKVPFLVGGSGLYVRSVVEGYNLSDADISSNREQLLKKSRQELLDMLHDLNVKEISDQCSIRHLVRLIEKAQVGDTKEKQSIPRYECLQIGIKWPREQIYKRIEVRLDQRLENIVKEVDALRKAGTTTEFLNKMGLEAKLASEYLDGKFESFDAFREELLKQERHFAKRQDTWFKKDVNTIWLDGNSDYYTIAASLVKEFLEN